MDFCIRQKPLNFKLENLDKKNLTAHSGAVLIHETLNRLGLLKMMKGFGLKKAGYGDEVVLEGLIQLLASGGGCLLDWEHLRKEKGFVQMFGGLDPAALTLSRYLQRVSLVVPKRESEKGQVGYISEFEALQEQMILCAYEKAGRPKKLTMDLDAMLIAAEKSSARFCYDFYKAYQPMNVYCPELEMSLAHEFRDGNVSPMEGLKRLIKRCQKLLPQVKWIVRSDSAGYQNELLDWMESQQIAYVITVRETLALQENFGRAKDWRALVLDGFNLEEEITEVFHTPTFTSQEELQIRMRQRRYLAIRKATGQQDLFNYHQVMVTNDLHSSWEKVIQVHRGRCGSVEYFHSQIKSQGADHVPSNSFKVNAAWYSLVCLTHNLIRFIQNFILPEQYKKIEIKTLRYRLLNLAAQVIHKARSVTLRFYQDFKALEAYQYAFRQLQAIKT